MAGRFGERPLRLEIVRCSDTQKGFVALPRRWVVERTFGWLNNFRRLSKDYEFRTDSSEAFIFLAASLLLIARLAGLRRLPVRPLSRNEAIEGEATVWCGSS